MQEKEPVAAPEATRRMPAWGYPLLVVAVCVAAMHGAFSLSKIFYVRDLSSYYWPQYLWMRTTALSGEFPLWDQYLAYGQSAIADPIRQLFFVPAWLLRMLLPDVVGFNLSVALPVPAAGLGGYLFFRRRGSQQAAALGAIVFALSGAMLSTANMINHSTSAACIPWVLWACDTVADRRSSRGFAALALAFALQALGGEGVTLVATAILAVAYVGMGRAEPGGPKARAVGVGLVAGAGAAGALLAAVQLMPMAEVLLRSTRGIGDVGDGWSVHPLGLLEAVVPAAFGDTMLAASHWSFWMLALNGGREPYLTSIYIGIAALLVALLGAAGGSRRWTLFWAGVAAVTVVVALGFNTPVYPFLKAYVPLFQTFRYPAKYLVFSSLAVAALVVPGWDLLARSQAARAVRAPLAAGLAVAAGAGAAVLIVVAAPDAAGAAFGWLAQMVGVANVEASVDFALRATAEQAPRLLGLALVGAGAIWLGASSRPLAAAARHGLFAVLVLDLLLSNFGLNPTMDAALLRAPAWVSATREHPEDRVYIGRGERNANDVRVDAPLLLGGGGDTPERAVAAMRAVLLSYMPSGWAVRESLSRDLTRLRALDYWVMADNVLVRDTPDRMRYLKRTGTRYFLLSEPPGADVRLVWDVPELRPLGLYELPDPAPRVAVVPTAAVEPVVARHTLRMTSQDFDPRSVVMLVTDPGPPAGVPGAAGAPIAEIVDERTNALTVAARAPEGGGYLVLYDTFDPGWRAEVDGSRAQVTLANGLFRAVRLAPGDHTVRFEYRPASLLLGAAVSTVVALVLLGVSVRPFRMRRAQEGEPEPSPPDAAAAIEK